MAVVSIIENAYRKCRLRRRLYCAIPGLARLRVVLNEISLVGPLKFNLPSFADNRHGRKILWRIPRRGLKLRLSMPLITERGGCFYTFRIARKCKTHQAIAVLRLGDHIPFLRKVVLLNSWKNARGAWAHHKRPSLLYNLSHRGIYSSVQPKLTTPPV